MIKIYMNDSVAGRLEIQEEETGFYNYLVHRKGNTLVFRKIFEKHAFYIDVIESEGLTLSLWKGERDGLFLRPKMPSVKFYEYIISWDGKEITFTEIGSGNSSSKLEIIREEEEVEIV
jgi:hypothetical protein